MMAKIYETIKIILKVAHSVMDYKIGQVLHNNNSSKDLSSLGLLSFEFLSLGLSSLGLSRTINKLLYQYIKYYGLYQLILWLVITYLIRSVLDYHISVVYAETLIDFLPRQDLDTYNDPFDHPTTFQGAGIPFRTITNNVIINNEPEPDGNLTAEDAAYHQRNPSELTEAHISEELTLKRIHFIDSIVQHSLQILQTAYSEDSIEKNLIPDGSIKNATFHTIITYGNISEWVTRTEADLKDVTSEANLRITLIQHILDGEDKLHPMERKVVCHVLTIMSLINSAEVLHLDIHSDKFKIFLEDDDYSIVYNKLTQDEFKHV